MPQSDPRSSSGPSQRLGSRMVRGGAWLGLLTTGQLLLSLARTVVLARILAPSDFGLFGMAILAVLLVRVVTETGFQQALIHRKEVSDRALDAAWSLLLVRNLGIAVLLALFADVVAGFFDEPGVAPLLRVLSISVVIEGMISISVVLFEKHLEFKKRFLYRMIGAAVEFAAVVTFAAIFRSAWALVAGSVAGAVAMVIVSYAVGQRRPRFVLSRSEARGLFGYGKWLTVSSILIYLLLHGGDIVVGRLLGAVMLGYYQMAFKLSNLPVSSLTSILTTVMFPALSSIQDQVARVASIYRSSIRLTMLVTAPITILLVPLAQVMTASLLSEKWLPAVPVIQVLAVFALVRSIGATTSPVFLALGRPDIRTKIQALQLVIFAVAVFPLANALGLVGIALAGVIYTTLTTAAGIGWAVRLCRLPARELIEPLSAPLSAALLSGGVVWILNRHVLTDPTLVTLVILVVVGVAVYGGTLLLIDRRLGGVYRAHAELLLGALHGRPA